MFNLEAQTADDRCEILVSGEIDIDCAEDFAQMGCLALESGTVAVLVVDLREVSFMDSTGLAALVRMNVAASASGKRFQIRNASAQVRKLLHITALDEVLTVVE